MKTVQKLKNETVFFIIYNAFNL